VENTWPFFEHFRALIRCKNGWRTLLIKIHYIFQLPIIIAMFKYTVLIFYAFLCNCSLTVSAIWTTKTNEEYSAIPAVTTKPSKSPTIRKTKKPTLSPSKKPSPTKLKYTLKPNMKKTFTPTSKLTLTPIQSQSVLPTTTTTTTITTIASSSKPTYTPSFRPTSVSSSVVTNEPTAMSGITAAHNSVRANVSPAPPTPMPAMVWDAAVALDAQAWANNCVWGHGGNPNEGQNIYAAAGFTPSTSDVVTSWANEVADYDYATNTCATGKVCGHYTQVVWASSTKLGCGMAFCTTNSPFSGFPNWNFWVCNYSPPGNYVGQKPY